MGKSVHPVVLDGALSVIRNRATHMVVLEGPPADFDDANDNALARTALVAADFTIGAGDVSGRKLLVAARAGLNVVAAGSANHVALLDVTNETLLYVTTCSPQLLEEEGSINVSGWSVEIGDPV